MRKILGTVTLLSGLLISGLGIYHYYSLSQKLNAGLKIESSQPATVFVNGVQIGQTPLDKLYKSGEMMIKLVPNSTTNNLTTYQTKVKLTAGTYTVIRRDFAQTEAETGGEIVSLEKTSEKSASLAVVVAGPDAASVVIDGEPQGLTPLALANLAAGDHQVEIIASGFSPRTVNAVAAKGHRLVINVKLAGQTVDMPVPIVDLLPSPSPIAGANFSLQLKKPYVEIKETPTGYLRVRNAPTVLGKEIGQVKPGTKLPLLENQSGWYRISGTFVATTSGWISAQYSDKFE